MKSKLIILAICVIVGLGVYYLLHNDCLSSYNTVFEATVIDKAQNPTPMGFGGSVKTVCVVELKPAHYVQFDGETERFTRFVADGGEYNKPCLYLIGDDVTVRPQTHTQAKILGLSKELEVIQMPKDWIPPCW